MDKAPAAFGVGVSVATWTDTRGTTENFYEGTSSPGRIMQVEILYPTVAVKARVVKPWAAPAYRYGPYPVIVFAHGYDVDPNTYRALLVSWVAAGYVVVAPFFPDTTLAAIQAQHGVDTEYDIFNQPADVAFVVSQVIGAAHRSPPPYAAYLAGLVDPAHLILAGQSDGADFFYRRVGERENYIEIVNHQVEHDVDVERARSKDAEPVNFEKHRLRE